MDRVDALLSPALARATPTRRRPTRALVRSAHAHHRDRTYVAQEVARHGWSPLPHSTLVRGPRSRRTPGQLLAFASAFPSLYTLCVDLDGLDDLSRTRPDASLALTFDANNLEDQRPFASHPAVANLHSLNLRGRLLERNGQLLSESALLEHVTHLSMSNSYLDQGCVDHILGGLDHSRLRALDLSHAQGTRTPTLRAKLDTLETPALEHLDLSYTFHSTEVHRPWSDLAHNPHLSGLTSLGAAGSCTREAALVALANSPNITGLLQLQLAGCWLKTPTSAAILTSPNTRHLISLSLNGARIKPAAFDALPDASFTSSLRSLDLAGVSLTHKLARALAVTPFERLRHLDLSRNHISRKTIDVLLTAPWLRGLEHLDLSYTHFDTGSPSSLLRHALAHPGCVIKGP